MSALAPMLPLKVAELNTLTSVGILAGWMLFPENEKEPTNEARRNKIINRYTTLEFVQRLNPVPADKALSLRPEALATVVLTALEAATAEELKKARNERGHHGCGTGYVLGEAIPAAKRGEIRAVTGAVDKVRKKFGDRKGTKSSDFNNKRSDLFPSVAALWASFVELYPQDDAGLFPCDPEDVWLFLWVAESFRRIGEKTLTGQNKQPILKPGISVRLPNDVIANLPSFDAMEPL